MDTRYLELFTLLSQTIENLAEQVMEAHELEHDDKSRKNAQIMRDIYATLTDKLKNDTVENLTKADYARLLIGSIIVANQLTTKIENDKKALQGYKIDIIPKLDQINNAATEEEAVTLAEKLFEVKAEEEEKSDK